MDNFSIKEQWNKECIFLKAIKNYFFITLGVLLGAGVVSGIILHLHPEYVEHTTAFIFEIFGDALKNIETDHDAFFFILGNNIRAMALMILWGFLPFIFLPMLSVGVNGAMLSFAWFLGKGKGMSFAAYLAHILPHGIIELPLMCLSAAVGLYLCHSVTKKIIGEEPLLPKIVNIIRTFFLIILPLTILAAAIEAYITPLIGGLFL